MDTKALQGKRIWILVGTRPEVIKQVPLYLACRERYGQNGVALVGTGQHRELLHQALAPFGVQLDVNLDVMKPNQSLTRSAADILTGMDTLFAQTKPEWIVVQGDTSSAAMAAIAAFHHGVRVAHNEAGLRSYDLLQPFPEECNRKLIAVVADLHLAPTTKAMGALRKEGIPEDRMCLVGNTGIDAMMMMLARPAPAAAAELLTDIRKMNCAPVLLTAHRRENKAERVDAWFRALAEFVEAHKDLVLVYPMHPNNIGRDAADRHLRKLDRVRIVEPLDYPSTCHMLQASRFVVTDSGGIQEEGATLGLPVVVCRNTTERAEAVEAGYARLVGTDVKAVLEGMEWANTRGAQPRTQTWPFGDGKSSARIAALLERSEAALTPSDVLGISP